MARDDYLHSLDNPRVKGVVRLRSQRTRRETGLFIAEGSREVQRALAAGLRPAEAFWCPPMLSGDGTADAPQIEELVPGLERTNARVWEVSEPLFRKMSHLENPEGLLAVFAQPKWALTDVLPAGETSADTLILVAAGTEKPGNLGAMVRSADAVGARGVLVADGVVDAFNPNAIRASTGAVFSLPVAGASSEEILAALRRARVRLFAASPGATTAYTAADLTGRIALAVGAEDTGLDPCWMEAAKVSGGCITIPMRGRSVDSLNASVTAGVLLFEALRQRTGK